MTGFFALLVVPLALLSVAVSRIPGRVVPEVPLGARFLIALTLGGAWLVLMTEILSRFDALSPVPIALGWLILALLGLLLPDSGGRPAALRQLREAVAAVRAFPWHTGSVVIILGVALTVAVVCPPNNWDSMTYHLPRAAHGLFNRNIEHFATANLWQIYYPPFAEWCLLHVMAIGRGDRFVNLVQWVAFAGCLAAAFRLAEQLHVSLKGRFTAAVLAATVPLAILEASTAQNDLVASVFLMIFAWLVMLDLNLPADARSPLWRSAGIGAALGLAIFSKATAYAYALPWLLWWTFRVFRASGFNGFWRLALAGAVTIALNAGHWFRNWELFGALIPLDTIRHSVETYEPAALFSNWLRNAALHWNTPFAPLNRLLQSFIEHFHASIGIGLYDPRISQISDLCCVQNTQVIDEDMTGNFLHSLLYFIALPGLLLSAVRTRRGPVAPVLATLAGILFVSIYLKWQPFNVRYHLPFYLLAAPLAADWIDRRRLRWPSRTLMAALVSTALLWPVFCVNRPILGSHSIFMQRREDLYFLKQPRLQSSYEVISRWIRDQKIPQVGILLNPGDWEYPFWHLVNGTEGRVQIEHVEVQNASARLADPEFNPLVIVAKGINGRLSRSEFARFRTKYRKSKFVGGLVVFLREPEPA